MKVKETNSTYISYDLLKVSPAKKAGLTEMDESPLLMIRWNHALGMILPSWARVMRFLPLYTSLTLDGAILMILALKVSISG